MRLCTLLTFLNTIKVHFVPSSGFPIKMTDLLRSIMNLISNYLYWHENDFLCSWQFVCRAFANRLYIVSSGKLLALFTPQLNHRAFMWISSNEIAFCIYALDAWFRPEHTYALKWMYNLSRIKALGECGICTFYRIHLLSSCFIVFHRFSSLVV